MVLAVDTKFPATDSYSIAAAKYQESRKLYLAGCILMAFGLVFSPVSYTHLNAFPRMFLHYARFVQKCQLPF